MRQYLELLHKVLYEGVAKQDRTGTGTRSIFGTQTRFNLQDGFPIVTTKKIHFKSVVHELLWFLKGSTNITYLKENGVHIWDEWADENGELGAVYGKQWRNWEYGEVIFKSGMGADGEWYPDEWGRKSIDQIEKVINSIKTDPYSRRHIVSAWNVADLDTMALPPCHLLMHFNCEPIPYQLRIKLYADAVGLTKNEGEVNSNMFNDSFLWSQVMNEANFPKFYLDCLLYQRSQDHFLGAPFNIASYSLLTHMIAQVTNTIAGEFIHTSGDVHLYSNHYEQALLQLTREPYPLPTLKLNPEIKNIDDFKFEDIELIGYKYHPHIKAPIAV